MSGRGVSDPHTRKTDIEEQEVPVISVDYACMGESATSEEREHLNTDYCSEGPQVEDN